MSKKITHMTAVAAVLAATAIAAPGAAANPMPPAGINAGLGPSSGLATTSPPSAGLGPSFGLAAVASASAARPPAATPAALAGGFDWGDASVGAAGMLALLGLGAGSVALIRRSGAGSPQMDDPWRPASTR